MRWRSACNELQQTCLPRYLQARLRRRQGQKTKRKLSPKLRQVGDETWLARLRATPPRIIPWLFLIERR